MAGLIGTVWVKAEDGVNAVAFGPDSGEIPGWALDQIGEHAFESGEKPGAGSSGTDYSKSKKADLEAEIDKRNADRDEDSQIVPDEPGNKPELIAALEADDTAQADQA